MKKLLRLFSALLLSALLFGCSEVNVTNTKWTCEKNKQTCNVVFSVINKSNESVSTAILIRAYDRVGRGKGAISNILIGEKTINIILLPNEHVFLNETLTVHGRVSMLVATIINNKD
ncbi:MAG: hypothetical protein L3J00_00365 [Thiomicrorhabdus sp.]|nr:hypothetical protein [Thiomicrorhabdus sp.]